MQRSWVIGRNSLLNGLDLGIGLTSGILCSVLVARAMGPTVLGDYNYVTWLVFTAGYMANFGLPNAVRKFASEHLGGGRSEKACLLIRSTFWLQCALGVALAAIGLGLGWLWLPAEKFAYAAPAIISAIPMMAIGTLTAANSAREDLRPNTLASIVSSMVILIVTLATLRFGWGLPGLTSAILASRTVDAIIRYAGFRVLYGPILWQPGHLIQFDSLSQAERRQYFRFCWEATLLMLVQVIVWGRSELWFLNRFWPKAEVSFYSLGFNFTDKISLVPLMVAGAVSASLMVEFGRSPQLAGRMGITSLRYLALLTLPMLTGLAALSRPLVLALYQDKFIPAIAPLVVQCILLMPRVVLNTGNDLLVTADRQRDLIRWGLLMCLVTLGLDYWWVRNGGALGAAWANGIAQMIATAGIWWLALRAYNLHFPFRALSRIALASSLMGAGVWAVVRSLPPVPGLVAGVPVGIALYLVLLKITGSLNDDDRRRLLTLERVLPGRVRPAYGLLLGRLVS